MRCDPDGGEAVGGHRTPGRGRRLNTDPEEAEEGLEQDGRGHPESGLHDDRAKGVREDVPEQDLGGLGAARPGGFDELALAQRERLATNQASHIHPARGDDGDDDVVEAGAQQQQQDHGHQQVGDAVEDVDDERHDRVEPPPVVAGEQPDRDANREDEHLGADPDDERDLGPDHQPAQHVAAEDVGAEPVGRAWARVRPGHADFPIRVRRMHEREQRDADE